MKSWLKVKLGQVGIGLNIASALVITHLASMKSFISGHLPQFIWKVDQKWNQVKLESDQTLLKITPLGTRKSYLVIIYPKSHAKFFQNQD